MMADGGADLFGGLRGGLIQAVFLGEFRLRSSGCIRAMLAFHQGDSFWWGCKLSVKYDSSTHCPRENYRTFVQRPHHRKVVVLLQGSLLGSRPHAPHLLLFMRLQKLEFSNRSIANWGLEATDPCAGSADVYALRRSRHSKRRRSSARC